MDCLLNMLLKIARDKAFEAWEKLKKGKAQRKIKEVDKRHVYRIGAERSSAFKKEFDK